MNQKSHCSRHHCAYDTSVGCLDCRLSAPSTPELPKPVPDINQVGLFINLTTAACVGFKSNAEDWYTLAPIIQELAKRLGYPEVAWGMLLEEAVRPALADIRAYLKSLPSCP